MQVGEYIISPFLNHFRLNFIKNKIRYNLDIDLSSIINEYVNQHIDNIKEIIAIYNLPDPSFNQDSLFGKVIANLKDEDLMHQLSRSEEINMLINSYNNLFSTHFTYDMIQGF